MIHRLPVQPDLALVGVKVGDHAYLVRQRAVDESLLCERQSARGQNRLTVSADVVELRRERAHPAVLGMIARLRPELMIAVLLAPARVPTGRLEVTIVMRTDPYVGPGGWDYQRFDPLQGRGFSDAPAAGMDVAEALAGAAA